MTGADEAAVVAAARACVGTRFRLQGRSCTTGLDCVGLVAVAFDLRSVPAGYPLRGGDPARIAETIEAAGFVRAEGLPRPADLLLVAPGPYQAHLLILTDGGYVHADATLRRVTEVAGPPAWDAIGRWRRY